MAFSELGLLPQLLKAIAEQGYTEPTPVQAQAIPLVLEGRDVMAIAQTGTGKTAGFTLPMLQILSPHANTSTSPARHQVRALILVPTRELAMQVEESVRTYGKHIGLRYGLVYGGVNIDPQMEMLRNGVEILVATPGRLLDHVQQRTVNLSQVQILVLDEADRMLDMGFLPDIRRILSLLPARRQNLMFSATFSEDIRGLAGSILSNPVRVEVARRNAAAELVRQVVHPVDSSRKRALLAHLVKAQNMGQVLVFCSTKIGATRLARELERAGVQATALHSDRSQIQRTQALADFKSGTVRVLVATDIAGRGLDIEELPHVFNFDLPHNPEDYVHRIGRTGRAGLEGDAISLVTKDEEQYLAQIERLLKKSIPREIVPGFEPGSHQPREGSSRAGRRGGPERPERRDGPSRGRGRDRSEKSEPRPPSGPPAASPSHVSIATASPAAAPAESADTDTQTESGHLRPSFRRRGPREVPALLGGVPKKA